MVWFLIVSIVGKLGSYGVYILDKSEIGKVLKLLRDLGLKNPFTSQFNFLEKLKKKVRLVRYCKYCEKRHFSLKITNLQCF